MSKVFAEVAPIRERIGGLDSLRFVCAVIVMLGHYRLPTIPALKNADHGILLAMRGLIDCLFNGPAAVIVFFVISGFCIHFPFSGEGANKFEVRKFYIRRLTRICLPVLAVIPLYLSIGVSVNLGDSGVLWSILCEIIYYLLYPIIIPVARRYGFHALIVTAFVVAAGISVSELKLLRDTYNAYVAFGAMTWIIGLPCWLLGCKLAETLHNVETPGNIGMLAWRAAITGISILLRITKFHVTSEFASNVFTLNAFSILVYFWLQREIAFSRSHLPSKLLESCGKWSYSLYLIHPISHNLIEVSGGRSQDGSFIFWCAEISLSLALAFVFYLVIERPAHQLALRLSSSRRTPFVVERSPESSVAL
jgi:peptidoglycan/LPS O-acetylase OafA/YrhL